MFTRRERVKEVLILIDKKNENKCILNSIVTYCDIPP